MNIFVGNLAKEVTQEDLQEVFTAFGQVSMTSIIKDKMTGEPRGFGFVEMPNKAEAEAAISGVKEIKGKLATVNEARPRESSGPRGGGGYGNRRPGGFGRNKPSYGGGGGFGNRRPGGRDRGSSGGGSGWR